MKVGVLFPQFEVGADPSGVRDFTQAAEELGYAHVTAFDQVVGLNRASRPDWPYIHDADDMFHELFVLFGFMAAITETIELVTGVLILPMRGTAVVAKQAAEVDVLSRGRLRLGVGVGVKPDEFAACGEEFSDRGKRTDEQIDVLRRLWTEDLITYHGTYHEIRDGGINPLPVQRPIPIWIGGISDAAMRRVARCGDGWMPNFAADDWGRAAIETMRTYTVAEGRDPDAIGIEATVPVVDRTPDDVIDELTRWEELGATHATLSTMPESWVEEQKRWNKTGSRGLADPGQHIDLIREMREALAEWFTPSSATRDPA
jgi:probable F420-dependent oxidoreductase